MLERVISTKFLKDYTRMAKRHKNLEKLDEIMALIALEEPLPDRCRPHILSGNYDGFWECHIENDWIMIYRYDDDDARTEVTFSRNGTHSDLF